MDNLMLNLTSNAGAWEGIINWLFSFIGNVGWVVIILTIAIKLVLSPFEFLQKKSMKKMTASMSLMQPEIEKIKAKCGNNQELYNQKMQELYKKHNINPTSGCGAMLLYMALSTFIFISFFNCLTGVSKEQINSQYKQLENVYTVSYNYYSSDPNENIEIDGVVYKIREDQKSLIKNNSDYNLFVTEYNNVLGTENEIKGYKNAEEYATQKRIVALSQSAVVDGITLYKEDGVSNTKLDGFTNIKQGFLWVKNIWRSDHYNSVFPSANEFIKESGIKFKQKNFVIDQSDKSNYDASLITEENGVVKVKGYYQNLDGSVVVESESAGKTAFITTYNTVTNQINKVYNGWNGYLILVVMVALLTLFSSYFTNIGSKTTGKNGVEVNVKPQKKGNVMMIVLTGLFVWITWSYTAAFALYIVTSSLISIPISIAMNYIINALERKEKIKNEVSYSRYKH